MKRHIPGLHVESKNAEAFLEGSFLVRVDHLNFRWHPQKPCYVVSFSVLEPSEFHLRHISARVYCTQKALWRLNWFLRDFGYDIDLLGRDEVDEKAVLGLTGVIRTKRKTLNGRSFQNLDGFAPADEWETLSTDPGEGIQRDKGGSDGLQLHPD
jgi:hypothetical protein